MDAPFVDYEMISYSEQIKPTQYESFQLSIDEEPIALLPMLTDQEKKLFLEIYAALVNKNAISLLFMKGYLEEQSSKLRHVHPLSTLVFIQDSPRMQYYLNKLRKKTFVTEPWDRSCKDFIAKMGLYKKRNALCLEDFYEKIKPEKKIRALALIEADRFLELLEFFLY